MILPMRQPTAVEKLKVKNSFYIYSFYTLLILIFHNFAKNTVLTNTPCNEATQDASSIEIFPLGNGVSSDVNKIIDGLLHPSNTPNPMVAKFTVKSEIAV